MRRTIILILLILISCSSPEVKIDREQKGKLNIVVNDLRNNKGKVLIAITSEEDKLATHDPLSSTAGFIVAASISDEIEVSLPDFPHGVYAIMHVHDENNNGKIDLFIPPKEWLFFNPFVWPVEGYGFSTVRRASIGQYSFDGMKFDFNKPEHTELMYTSYFWDRYAILCVLAINAMLSGGGK